MSIFRPHALLLLTPSMLISAALLSGCGNSEVAGPATGNANPNTPVAVSPQPVEPPCLAI